MRWPEAWTTHTDLRLTQRGFFTRLPLTTDSENKEHRDSKASCWHQCFVNIRVCTMEISPTTKAAGLSLLTVHEAVKIIIYWRASSWLGEFFQKLETTIVKSSERFLAKLVVLCVISALGMYYSFHSLCSRGCHQVHLIALCWPGYRAT